MSSLILILLSSLFPFMDAGGGGGVLPRGPCTHGTHSTAGLGQAVTPRFLGSLAAMLTGRDSRDGPQAAPADGAGEDRVAHRARPLPSQGGGAMGSLSLCPVPREGAGTTVGPSTASLWMFFVEGDGRAQQWDAARDRQPGALTRPSPGTPRGRLERRGLPRLFTDARDKVISVSR